MAASVVIAIAAPIGVKQVLTVKTQKTENTAEQAAGPQQLTTPVLLAPTYQGRSDIKDSPNSDSRNGETGVVPAPVRNADGKLFFEDFQVNGTVKFVDVSNDGKCWYWG